MIEICFSPAAEAMKPTNQLFYEPIIQSENIK